MLFRAQVLRALVEPLWLVEVVDVMAHPVASRCGQTAPREVMDGSLAVGRRMVMEYWRAYLRFANLIDALANPVSGRKPKETGLFVSFSAQEGRSE